MPSSFTLEDLAQAEKPFRSSVAAPEVAAETPPVEPEPTETPPAEGDVVIPESTPAAADEPAPVSANEEPKGSARERIEDLVAQRKALEKYIEYRESAWNQPTAAKEAPVAAVAEGAPTLESCQFDTDKWTKAMNAWTSSQIQSGIKQALQSEKQTATVEDQKAKFEQRMESFAKTTPDVKTVLGNPSLPQLSPGAAALVVASDLGPQILYHLGKNPAVAARIARQSPIEQGAAIGRLEAELKVPNPQKKLSNAPPPPTPNKGADAPTLDDTKMSVADFVKKERAALAARRQRH